MYQQFFGFNTLPFKITPDERVFFAGAHRQEMLDALLYGIERGEGIITVIGEVGIGKTTLARVLSNRFSDCFAIISIFTPNVSSLEMLRLIAQEAGLNPQTTAGKVELMQLIRTYCLALHQQGKRFLLLIDEAQTMLIETIEELRLLSNMQVDDIKLVQVLLFGQPELDRMLNSPELRQVKDRVVFQIHIEPFSRDELSDYLAFRLQQAGYQGQYFFSTSVVDAIYRKSQGYARAVNRLADQALMAAFAEQTHQVLLTHVESSNQEAIQPLVSSPSVSGANINQVKRVSFALITGAVATLMIVGVVSAWFSGSSDALSVLSSSNNNSALVSHQPALEAESPQASQVASVGAQPPQSVAAVDTPVTPSAVSQPESLSVVEEGVETSIAATAELASEYGLLAGHSEADWQGIHQQQLSLFSQFAAENKYTIQLMSSPWRLRDAFVQEASLIVSRLPKAPAFYYDYSAAPDRPRIAAIYGVYDTKESAKQALRALSAMNKGYRPDMMSYQQVITLMNASQVLVAYP